MGNHLYSIITVCLDNEQGAAKTAESIVKQTFSNFEWIFIDGGSQDNSVNAIRDNPALTHLVSEPDEGIYHAMNKGVYLSQGDYCIFLNAGDWFYNENVLENVSNRLEGDLVVGWLNVIYPDSFRKQSKIRRLDQQDVRRKFLYHRTLHHQSTFIKRSLFKKYGCYDQTFKIYGDWDFFLRVINKGVDLKFIKLCIANYPFDGISSTSIGTAFNIKEINRIRQRHFSILYRVKRYIIDRIEGVFNIRGF
ncbi:glycosyltransferase family 2 protein [Candidatus Electronema sp. TJ]|uniref:glycosyltransferase family 2 protein n=1 Tax=Candidatus Electronema sp. TJ TaxID=3401573 RepID=UPI003AA93B05